MSEKSGASLTSSNPENVVRAFFQSWEEDGFVVAFQKYIHGDVLYQNLGFDDVRGKQAALGIIENYLRISNMPYGWVEMIGIAPTGNLVLTERVDHLFNEDRSIKHATPIMGAFEVQDGLIIRYSDYFDPRQFLDTMVVNNDIA